MSDHSKTESIPELKGVPPHRFVRLSNANLHVQCFNCGYDLFGLGLMKEACLDTPEGEGVVPSVVTRGSAVTCPGCGVITEVPHASSDATSSPPSGSLITAARCLALLSIAWSLLLTLSSVMKDHTGLQLNLPECIMLAFLLMWLAAGACIIFWKRDELAALLLLASNAIFTFLMLTFPGYVTAGQFPFGLIFLTGLFLCICWLFEKGFRSEGR